MMTITGIRNSLWCALAFAIIAYASAPGSIGDFTDGKAASTAREHSRPTDRGVEVLSNVDQARKRMVGTP